MRRSSSTHGADVGTVILHVDLQKNEKVKWSGERRRRWDAMMENVHRLSTMAREHRAAVYWILFIPFMQYERLQYGNAIDQRIGMFFGKGTEEAEQHRLSSECLPAAQDFCCFKSRSSAFERTGLADDLAGVRRCIVTGVVAGDCVYHTVEGAQKSLPDAEIIVARDAVESPREEGRDSALVSIAKLTRVSVLTTDNIVKLIGKKPKPLRRHNAR